jgi:ATP-binding cassette, subfamily F, member 3
MLYTQVFEKTAGAKLLLRDFELRLNDGEKLGFIGRNGTGKTTLFRILSGLDQDYSGNLDLPKNQVLMATLQEHGGIENITTIDYIASRLPRYAELNNIINTYPETMGENRHMQTVFADALGEFSDLGYYEIDNSVRTLAGAYQLNEELLDREFSTLSGGQKRLIDLIAIQIGKPSIALLDEPTNHMDYVAKDVFVEWLKTVDCSVIVISHDRDVLKVVDRVVELRDYKASSYPGNYDDYLVQNAAKTIGAIQGFETTEKRIENIKEQIRYCKVKAKSKAGGNTGRSGKNPWVVLQERLEKELAEILDTHEKPTFWIDRESASALAPKVTEKYEKYKARNIKMKDVDSDTTGILLNVEDLSLGYDSKPLFAGINFQLRPEDKLHIIGRNGAGKTTLVRAIMDAVNGQKPSTLIGKGVITPSRELRICLYEQELSNEMMDMTLYEAIEHVFDEKGVPINEQAIRQTMSNYLFEPSSDTNILVSDLSGGQKARLQLIRMMSGMPNLLILDEPTNHLDLPSIEELETALLRYQGAVIYISHDSYFAKNIGGTALVVGS